MEQWQAYPDSAGASGSRRYTSNGGGGSNQMSPRDYSNGQAQQTQQAQPPAGFKFDPYQGGLNPQPTASTSPMTSPQLRDGNGDVRMQDAHDPYAGIKYPMRPHNHQHQLSGSLPSNMHQSQEPSAAAQRYSPMEVLSPPNSYAPSKAAPGAGQFTQSPAQRQSPVRSTSDYAPQSPYYGSRQTAPQLPPINPYAPGQDYPSSAIAAMDGGFMDPKSPRRIPQPAPQFEKGPVPELKKIRGPGDLRPKVNSQPAFRRANPEGGFISVGFRPPGLDDNLCHSLANQPCDSPSKRSPRIFLPPTGYAIPASSTSLRGTLVAS